MPDSEEYFDVVDQHDNIVGRETRAEVHRKRLRHRAVHVFVIRPAGDMLIHKRSPDKEEFPSVWTSSCSGHVSSGESYEQAATRELQEELGLQSRLLALTVFAACEATSLEFTKLYLTKCADTPTPDWTEMTEIDWLSLAEIDRRLNDTPDQFSPAFALLFRWFRSARVLEMLNALP